MHAILQGDLGRFPAAELLTILRRHDGTLAVVSSEKRTRVVFRGGSVAAAESSEPGFELPALLAAYGLLTKEQLDELQSGGSGVITDRHRAFQASEIVFDLFTWDDGRFAFSDDASVAAPLTLDIDALIEEGTKRAAEVRKVLSLYPDDQVIFRVVEDPGPQAKISLSAEEFKLLFRIGAGRSLRQICTDVGRSPVDVYPVVHNLEASGLIAKAGIMAPAREKPSGPPPGPSSLATMAEEPMPKPQQGYEQSASDATMIQVPEKTEAGAKELPEADETAPPAVQQGLTTSGSQPRPFMGSLTQEGTDVVFPLMEDELIIGREASKSNPIAIALADGSVSSRHAKISRDGTGFAIEDVGSRNGTFVNGERVTDRRMLADNDLIRVGKVLLTFNLAAEVRAGETTQPELPIA